MTNFRTFVTLLLLTGCGSTSGGGDDGPVADAMQDSETIDAPTDASAATCTPACGAHATCDGASCVCDDGFQGDGISCRPYWKRFGSYAFDIAPLPAADVEPNVWPVVVGHRRSIFIGVQNHMPTTYPGWRSLDLAVVPPVLSAPLPLPPAINNCNELCTSAGREDLSSDGVGYVYMFGKEAQRYDVANNRWLWFSGYDPFRRSNSPQVFVPGDDTIQFFGGSDSTGVLATVLRYTISTNRFSVDPTPMPTAIKRASAWLPDGGSTIYVAGGQHDQFGNSMMPHNGIISRAVAGSEWTVHPDAPDDLRHVAGMGDYQGRIWVAARKYIIFPGGGGEVLPSKAFFFNPATNTWDRSVFLPTGTLAAVTADGATWALARTETDGVGGFDLYKLMTIDETPEP